MRHQCRVPQLGRPADQRKAMLRGLTTQLIREGRVTTTKARAKALRDEAERMITLAKEGSLVRRSRAAKRPLQQQQLRQRWELRSGSAGGPCCFLFQNLLNTRCSYQTLFSVTLLFNIKFVQPKYS